MSVSVGGWGLGGWTQISFQISNHDCLIILSVTPSYQSAGVWSPLSADGSSVSAHVDCAWDHWQRDVTALPHQHSAGGGGQTDSLWQRGRVLMEIH